MEAVPAVLGSKYFILLQTLSCSSQDGRNGLHYVGQPLGEGNPDQLGSFDYLYDMTFLDGRNSALAALFAVIRWYPHAVNLKLFRRRYFSRASQPSHSSSLRAHS